ncbi:hypothetical protein P4K96_32255, partial [Bacillus cereus]|nr:hypothetical protein [Bacillus cereus]
MLRIGIIGLDTSHVTAFTALLNDRTHPYHVPGGKVVAAYQGGTPGLELSMPRLKAYTDALVGQYGVTLVPDLPSLAEQCDVLLLEGCSTTASTVRRCCIRLWGPAAGKSGGKRSPAGSALPPAGRMGASQRAAAARAGRS